MYEAREERNADGTTQWSCYKVARDGTATLVAGPMSRPYEVRRAPLPHDHRYGAVVEWGPVDDINTGYALHGSAAGDFV